MPRTNRQYGNVDAKHQFAKDMRLVLYYGRIFKVYLEALRTNSVCPSGVKQNCLNTEATIRRQENTILLNISEKDREFLRKDLNKDQIIELGEIISLLANVYNPEAVTDAVRKAKFEKQEMVYENCVIGGSTTVNPDECDWEAMKQEFERPEVEIKLDDRYIGPPTDRNI